MSGVIGDVLSVDFHWLLNTVHGADYFRRWHSHKKNLRRPDGPQGHASLRSRQLVARQRAGAGTGQRQARVLHAGDGEAPRPRRAITSAASPAPRRTSARSSSISPPIPDFKELYLDNEQHDGYFRDRCVFRPRHRHRGHDERDRELRHGRDAESIRSTRSTPGRATDRVQRHEGPARAPIVEQAAHVPAGATNSRARTRPVRTRVIPLRGSPRRPRAVDRRRRTRRRRRRDARRSSSAPPSRTSTCAPPTSARRCTRSWSASRRTGASSRAGR